MKLYHVTFSKNFIINMYYAYKHNLGCKFELHRTHTHFEIDDFHPGACMNFIDVSGQKYAYCTS